MKILLLVAGFALGLGVEDNLFVNFIGLALIALVVFNTDECKG